MANEDACMLRKWEDGNDPKKRYLASLFQLARGIEQNFMGGGGKRKRTSSLASYLLNMSERLFAIRRVLKDTGVIYLHCDWNAGHYIKIVMDVIFDKKNFRNEIVWCYSGGGIPGKDFPRKHDTLFRYTNSDIYTFHVIRKPYKENTQQVGIHSTYSGKGNKIDLERGTPITDWWTDIKTVTGWNPERLGYPTQKPLALLERIITTSSNEDDLILDPFCGCGTAVHAAEKLGRQWIGVDISHFAVGLMQRRVLDPENNLGLSLSDISVHKAPLTADDAKRMALQDRFKFEEWVLGYLQANQLQKGRGPDGGIDGILEFYTLFEQDEEGNVKGERQGAIVQVKSGKVTPDAVKALHSTVLTSNLTAGIFVCFKEYKNTVENVLGNIKDEFRDVSGSYPVMQWLSVEDMLNGVDPKLPVLRPEHGGRTVPKPIENERLM